MPHKNLLKHILFICLLVSFTSCYYDQADYLYPNPAPCDTTNITYTKDIKAILTRNCLNQGCHLAGSNFGGVILEDFTKTSEAISSDRLINSVKYSSGGAKNMPPTGKLSPCEIDKIDAWIKQGNPEN
jgi:hypothetical protein